MSYVQPNSCQATSTTIKGQPAIRDAIMALLNKPQSVEAAAAHLGRSIGVTRCHLGEMTRVGSLVRVGRACLVRSDCAGAAFDPVVRRLHQPAGGTPAFRRPQPIRDAILAFLTEPRSALAIAEHIERPVPTATGHLAAVRRLGLVKRIGRSAYANPSYEGPPAALTGGKAGVA